MSAPRRCDCCQWCGRTLAFAAVRWVQRTHCWAFGPFMMDVDRVSCVDCHVDKGEG